ncbi:cobyrinate a,c-diamide synthase [Siminovitchia sp. 179-K 8D1 HS]|uniref:cobyrinate a,c-diamide synthase n=1 Tax=Siminovitchia sp. 179-K 8D1 HS TaxID=3142385 RepID=UPI0039A3262A
MQKRLVIAGTGSGAGKTTWTIGLMQAFKDCGLHVQGFKCGPDYIDPTYHTAVTGRPSRNLDSWMLDKETVKDIFIQASRDADLSIIEGVMGFYDGKSPKNNVGSTAEISILLEAPVLLVVNISSMARSAAAIVKGFQRLDPNVNIAGVLLNQAGSEGHAKLCGQAIEQECGIPVVGHLVRGDIPKIPERHLGLIPAIERGELSGFFKELGKTIREKADLDKILQLADTDQAVVISRPTLFGKKQESCVRIAVARDVAFNFYYPENLALLEAAGAELVYFSPLEETKLPEEIDGLYIGGGFPEEFAKKLAGNTAIKQQIKKRIEAGLPTLAECGGFVYLTESLTTADGRAYPMVGLIPAHVAMTSKRAALGYREITSLEETIILGKGETAKGHEFHYFSMTKSASFSHVYHVQGLRGEKEEGFYLPNVAAGFTHLHFASNTNMPQRFVQYCLDHKGGSAWKKQIEKTEKG